MDVRRLTLEQSHPVDGPGWVYAWLWPDGVRYIGATWLDPAVRVEHHLHGDTADPRSLALRAAVSADGGPLQVTAMAVPAGADRKAYKQGLIDACRDRGLLGEHFIEAGDAGAPATDDTAWVAAALQHLRSV